MNREIKLLVREAERQGWRIEYTGGGHLKWFAPNGGPILVSASTPSKHARSYENHLANMKRAGFRR